MYFDITNCDKKCKIIVLFFTKRSNLIQIGQVKDDRRPTLWKELKYLLVFQINLRGISY